MFDVRDNVFLTGVHTRGTQFLVFNPTFAPVYSDFKIYKLQREH